MPLPLLIVIQSDWSRLLIQIQAHFQLAANQITWSRLLIQIHILNDKQCRSRSVAFWRSLLIWIYTVCECRAYSDSAGWGLIILNMWFFSYHWRTICEKGLMSYGDSWNPVNPSLAEHDMPCLCKQCRPRSVGFCLSLNMGISIKTPDQVIRLARN